MPEGKVRNTGGATITLKQEFIITDHQGNARISFEDNGSGVAAVKQENSYYAFGLSMTSTMALPTAPNKNLYNGGAEWQNDFADQPDWQQTFYRNYDQATGRFLAADPMADASESMTVYQYAGNNPIMMNDPMGNLQMYGGRPQLKQDYSHGVGDYGDLNNYLNYVENTYGAGGGQSIHVRKSDEILDIFNSLAMGKNVSFNFNRDGTYNVSFANALINVNDPNDFRGSSGIIAFGDNDGEYGYRGNLAVMNHDEELAKYGQIETSYNVSDGASLTLAGATVETGVIITDKGWARKYKTVYYSPGFASPFGALGFSVVSPISNNYLPTFSDWNGAMVGFSGSVDFVSGNVGFTSAYFVWGLGVSAAPEFLTIPAMKGVNGGGSMNIGDTTWIGDPFEVGNLNLPGADQRYRNTQITQGGY